jgi:hypothetical protein
LPGLPHPHPLPVAQIQRFMIVYIDASAKPHERVRHQRCTPLAASHGESLPRNARRYSMDIVLMGLACEAFVWC